jgi:thioredoxin 1
VLLYYFKLFAIFADCTPKNNSKYNIMAIEVNDNNFDDQVIKSDKPVMVDFWAEWCGPCRMVAPIMEEISREYEGKAVVVKCDVDSSPGVAAKYSIRNIPTVLFFKDGKIADKQVGAVPKNNFVVKLNALL